MAALTKARDISAYLAKPHFDQKIILLYGPDQGLVSERADFLATASGVDLSDPFSLIRLDADDAAADSARLSDEAHTIGMFGGSRLIRVSGTTRRDLGKAIKPLLQTPPEDALVLIEGGDLKRNSGLLNQLSKSPNALCIACYQDMDAALEQLIDEEITGKGLKIDRETRVFVKSMLGDNRMVSRGELAKLALYCEGRQIVSMDDVRNIMGDASKLVMDDLIDAVSIGNAARLQEVLPKAIEAGNSADMITWAVLRHFQFLHLARSKVEQNRQPASSVVDGARPPIHFSRKDAVKRALSIWPLDRIGRALTRLDTTFFECRQKADTAPSLTGTTLLALCLEAQVLARRR